MHATHQAPVAAEVRRVQEEPKHARKVAIFSDYVVMVIGGQVVTSSRRSAFLGADGKLTLPVEE